MIKNLVFDLGNVLVEFKPKDYMERLGFPETTINDLYQIIFKDKRWGKFDIGDITIEEYVSTEYPYEFVDTNLRKIITTFNYNMCGIIPVIDHSNYVQGYLTKGALLSSLSRQFTSDGSLVEESGIIA